MHLAINNVLRIQFSSPHFIRRISLEATKGNYLGQNKRVLTTYTTNYSFFSTGQLTSSI